MQRERRPRDDERFAGLLGKRAALILCGTVSVWFVVASVSQIVPAVFGVGVVPLDMSHPGSAEHLCAEGLRARTLGPAAAPDPAARKDPAALRVPADFLTQACGETPAGRDAWAALERLEMAEDQLKGSDPGSVEALRRTLSAHLPVEMR